MRQRSRSVVLALAAVLLTGALAEADVRFYVVPKIGTGVLGANDPLRAKYVHPMDGEQWIIRDAYTFNPKPLVQIDFGEEPAFLVGADVTPAEHAALAAQPDVIVIPTPLSSNVGAAALPQVQAQLEALGIPGNWVTTSHTWRQVLQIARRMMTFSQFFQSGAVVRIFQGGVTLDTRINQLPTAVRNRLIAECDLRGLDRTGITNNSTLRAALLIILPQLPALTLLGEES